MRLRPGDARRYATKEHIRHVDKMFVSAGTPADKSQEAFRDSIVRAVKTSGLAPRLMTPRDWDFKNPLRGLRRAMSDCSGAIVIAYTRYQFPTGIEKRAGQSNRLEETSFPTIWNQIEAAMAYEKGLPLLIVAQSGLRQEAMLENSADSRPYWTELDPSVCDADGFIGYLHSWKEDVVAMSEGLRRNREIQGQEVTVRTLVSSLPWYEGIAVVSTIIGLVVAALTIGYRLGSGQWPFQ